MSPTKLTKNHIRWIPRKRNFKRNFFSGKVANFLQQSGSPGKNVTPLKNTSLETSSVFHCREKNGKQIFGTTSFCCNFEKIRIFFFGCCRCFDCNKFFTSDVVRSCSISGEVRACVMSDPNQCFSYQERGVGAIEGVVIMVWVKKEQRNAFLNAFRWMCESTATATATGMRDLLRPVLCNNTWWQRRLPSAGLRASHPTHHTQGSSYRLSQVDRSHLSTLQIKLVACERKS